MSSSEKRRSFYRRLLPGSTSGRVGKESKGRISEEAASSKDGDTVESVPTSSDVKRMEPQGEESTASVSSPIAIEDQESQTPASAMTENFEDSCDPKATITEAEEAEVTPAPSNAPETELVKSSVHVASNLWHEAYDTLKTENADQLDHYERILTLWLRSSSSELTPRRPSLGEHFDNEINALDPRVRREQMSKIVDSWFQNYDENEESDNESTEDGSNDADIERINIVHSLREIMRSTTRDIDAAPLWVGACLSVESLSSPTFKPETAIAGIGYIISRLAWYSILPNLLASDGSDGVPEGEDFNKERQHLRAVIIGLFKAILMYQIRVVCAQSDHLRGLASDNLLESSPSANELLSEADIVDAEKALACFRGKEIEACILRFVEVLKTEKLDADRDEDDVKTTKDRLLKDLNAIDTQTSTADFMSRNARTLKSLFEWVCSTVEYIAFGKGDERVLWVSGGAGTGTTMVMLAVIHGLSQQAIKGSNSHLLSYSFCSNGKHRPENAAAVVKSLIFLVLEYQPNLVNHLAITCESTGRKHFSDPEDFYALSLVLFSMIQDYDFKPTIFVIDGIDECIVDWSHTFLNLIVTTKRLSDKVKWVISIISEKRGSISSSLPLSIRPLIDLDTGYEKVKTIFDTYYIPSKVDELAKKGRYEGQFRVEVTGKLRRLSLWNFLWADIACEAIKRDVPWHALENLDLPVSIDPLYSHMKGEIEALGSKHWKDARPHFRVLLAMVVAFRPLDITELGEIVDLPPEIDLEILVREKCFAFLELFDEKIHFTHHSARKFIEQDMKRYIPHAHSRVVERCLRSLSKPWEMALSDSDEGKKGQSSTKYAAAYWIRHLYYSEGIERDDVRRFLDKYPLKWIDLLASNGQIAQAWELMRGLETILKGKLEIVSSNSNASYVADQEFVGLIRETHQLLHFHLFTESPSRVGAKNSLLFCPNDSTTRQRHLPSEFPELAVPPVVEQNWSRVVHVLRGHNDYVRACAYSHDGRFLASASDDYSVRIWDTTTGKAQHSFQGFDDWVYLVAISSKGVVAASDRRKIRIWEIATGNAPKELNGRDLYMDNGGRITDISFSSDGSMLVAVGDTMVTIWELLSYSVIVQEDPGFEDADVKKARFSSDGALLGTVLEDRVMIWKLENASEDEETANGDAKPAEGLAEGLADEPAEKHVEENSENRSVEDADAALAEKEEETVVKETGNLRKLQKVGSLEVDGASGFAFSPDSKYVATGSTDYFSENRDHTVQIWEWRTENPPIALLGHTDDVTTVSFSGDGSLLASGSDDKTIRIWKAPWDKAKQAALVLKGHSRAIYALSFAPYERHLATCSSDGTLRIWDYDGYEDEGSENSNHSDDEKFRQAQPHTRPICCIASSHNGKFIATASEDGLIYLWDRDSNEAPRKLDRHDSYVRSLVFSSDSERLVSVSNDPSIWIWDMADKLDPRPLLGHTDWVRAAVFSHHRRLLISGSDDCRVRVWDITRPNVGEEKKTNTDEVTVVEEEQEEEEREKNLDGIRVLLGHSDYVTSVACSEDEKFVAAGGDDGKILLWELSNEQSGVLPPLKTMNCKSRNTVRAVVFVHGTSRLIASSYGKLSIWNTETSNLIQEINIERTFYTLQIYPEHPQYLITEVGPVYIKDLNQLPTTTKATDWCPYSVTSSYSGSWITWYEKPVIFLPGQYCPASDSATVRVQNNNVLIGCESGRVLFFRFKEVVDFGDGLGDLAKDIA